MRIAFRIDKQREITAVFLTEVNNVYKYELMCYAHLGQHGGCSIDWLYQDTRPATKDQYAALLSELISAVGYSNLKVVRNLPAYSTTVELINGNKGA